MLLPWVPFLEPTERKAGMIFSNNGRRQGVHVQIMAAVSSACDQSTTSTSPQVKSLKPDLYKTMMERMRRMLTRHEIDPVSQRKSYKASEAGGSLALTH